MNGNDSKIMKIVKSVFSVFGSIAPETATKILFKKYLGYKLNMDNPQTLNEKLQYLKLRTYAENELVTQCADKYAVREYVKRCGCENTLVDLLGVWDNADEVDFESLPSKFAIKCNHGTGSNILCTNKSKLDVKNARKLLDKWMHEDTGRQRVEMSYSSIDRKIIAESFIETSDGKPPKDYKIFCSYGEPKFLFVASDRFDNQTKFDYFTLDWKWIPVKNGHPNAGPTAIKCPEGWNEMLEAAKKLSKPFPLVRVDFYYENGKVIFGELTFMHFGGLTPFDPSEYDLKLGKLIDSDIREGMKY